MRVEEFSKMFVPLHDWCLVRMIKEGISPGGIEYPENYHDESPKAEVLAVGNGVQLQDGTFREMLVKKGDVVLVSGMMVTVDSAESIAFAREGQLIAIVKR